MTDNLDKIKAALEACCKTMKEAEDLIASEHLHDKWHVDGKPHTSFHDLLFKRIRGEEALSLLDDMRGEVGDAGEIIKDVLFSSGWPSIDGVVVEILQALRSSGHLKEPEPTTDNAIRRTFDQMKEVYNATDDTRQSLHPSQMEQWKLDKIAVAEVPSDMPKEIWVFIDVNNNVSIKNEMSSKLAYVEHTKYTRSDLSTRPQVDADVVGHIKETSRLINIARGSSMADLDSWLSCADDRIKAALSLLNGEKDKI